MVSIRKALLVATSTLASVQSVLAYQNYESCVNPGDFALTFDDGPNVETTDMILDYLKKENVKATFFVNGNNYLGDIKEDPKVQERIKREYEEGHVVASHTYNHPSDGITKLSDEELTHEIKDLNDALYDLIQVRPAFFRPPLGEYNEKNEKVIEREGFTANILWTIDPNDWRNKGQDDIESYFEEYKTKLEKADPTKDSFIALNHDVYMNTAKNLIPLVVPLVKEKGFRFVTMDECLGMTAYQGINSLLGKGNSTEVENPTASTNSTNVEVADEGNVQHLERSGAISTKSVSILSAMALLSMTLFNLF